LDFGFLTPDTFLPHRASASTSN